MRCILLKTVPTLSFGQGGQKQTRLGEPTLTHLLVAVHRIRVTLNNAGRIGRMTTLKKKFHSRRGFYQSNSV
jgi:hypothetical protein